jgi:uncharacterized membrane protein
MTRFELVCLTIVSVYAALRLAKSEGKPGDFIARFGLLALSSMIAEDTIIRAYGYYGYATTWSLFLDRVPLVVVLVWPVVVDSAAVLARAVLSERSRTPLGIAALTAGIVLADAALIEPVAVRAGLWRWTEPGVFGVPIIGILGWAIFAFVATFVIETRARIATIAIAPIATHAILLAAWWGGLRLAETPISSFAVALLTWGASIAFVTRAAARPVPMSALLMRAPGAVFFFVLLATNFFAPAPFAEPWSAHWIAPPASAALLVTYVAAFAAPYLTAVVLSGARRSGAV